MICMRDSAPAHSHPYVHMPAHTRTHPHTPAHTHARTAVGACTGS